MGGCSKAWRRGIFRGEDIWEAVLQWEVRIFRGEDIWEDVLEREVRIFLGEDILGGCFKAGR